MSPPQWKQEVEETPYKGKRGSEEATSKTLTIVDDPNAAVTATEMLLNIRLDSHKSLESFVYKFDGSVLVLEKNGI